MTDMYTIFNMDIVNRKKHSIENIQFGQATCEYVYLNGRTKLYICDIFQHHLNMHTTMIHIQQHQNVHRNTIQYDRK